MEDIRKQIEELKHVSQSVLIRSRDLRTRAIPQSAIKIVSTFLTDPGIDGQNIITIFDTDCVSVWTCFV